VALSHFFEVPFSQPAEGLIEGAKASILGWAAFDLRAVGRLLEAISLMQAGLKMAVKQEAWEKAAIGAGNLSELMLTLGEVSQAVDYAEQCVTFADRIEKWEVEIITRTTLADALHQSGRLAEAEKHFLEAEAKQKKRQPRFPFLYSLQGYEFCDLLLGSGKYREVMERAGQDLNEALEIAELGSMKLFLADYHLEAGRLYLAEKKKTEAKNHFNTAKEMIDKMGYHRRDQEVSAWNDGIERGVNYEDLSLTLHQFF
jgi:tetratricopeptide (TPR) repeat protein